MFFSKNHWQIGVPLLLINFQFIDFQYHNNSAIKFLNLVLAKIQKSWIEIFKSKSSPIYLR